MATPRKRKSSDASYVLPVQQFVAAAEADLATAATAVATRAYRIIWEATPQLTGYGAANTNISSGRPDRSVLPSPAYDYKMDGQKKRDKKSREKKRRVVVGAAPRDKEVSSELIAKLEARETQLEKNLERIFAPEAKAKLAGSEAAFRKIFESGRLPAVISQPVFYLHILNHSAGPNNRWFERALESARRAI